MDEAMGGLAIAAGRAGSPILPPPTDGLPTIGVDQIDPDRWHRANYQAGDVLIFDPSIAHSGLVNRSKYFRMSVDVRLSTDSARFPMIGAVVEISKQRLSIQTAHGVHHIEITPETLCRDERGVKIPSAAIGTQFAPGNDIVIAADAGRAIMVRAPK